MYYHNKIVIQFLFVLVSFAFVESKPCDIDATADIVFQLYTRNYENYTTISNDGNVAQFLSVSTFNKAQKTFFYFPGLNEDPSQDDSNTNKIIQAFVKLNNVNLVVINYINSSLNTPSGWCKVQSVASALSYFLNKYIPSVQKVNQLHFLGFDIGAYIMGAMAQYYGQGQLRLTALNPTANLLTVLSNYLNEGVGSFLDIISTDEYMPDIINFNVGDMNFYINNIFCQPTCDAYDSTCNHNTVLDYYAASVQNPNNFIGQCQYQCGLLLLLTCSSKSPMGYGLNSKPSGLSCSDFYVQTSGIPPYGLTNNGLSTFTNYINPLWSSNCN